MILHNVGHYLSTDAASHPRILEYSAISAACPPLIPTFKEVFAVKSSVNSSSFL
jgi:hypothetical protein